MRRKTLSIKVGNVGVGSKYPVSIQSMTNTKTENTAETLQQIQQLAAAGCQIIRSTVPNKQAAQSFKNIVQESPIPVIADIHFDYRLAIQSIKNGAAAIRINPGNIGTRDQVRQVMEVAGEYDIPVRVGVNGGSLPENLIKKYNGVTPEGMVETALQYCEICESFGHRKIKVSIKCSSGEKTIAANRLFAQKTDYPLHLGLTEAGTKENGTIKSACVLGALLFAGIGDTIRVSLTGSPLDEVLVAQKILESTGHRDAAPEIIACPTCGRTEVNLENLVRKIETYINNQKAKGIKYNLKSIAVMGCIVNGPGEASEADIGIACGKERGIIFKNGETLKAFPEQELEMEFIKILQEYEC